MSSWVRKIAIACPCTSAVAPRSTSSSATRQTGCQSSVPQRACRGHGAPTGIVVAEHDRLGRRLTGRIWPRSVAKEMFGSGVPGALTNDTNRASFVGVLEGGLPLVEVGVDVPGHRGLQLGAEAERVVDDDLADPVQAAVERVRARPTVRCSRSAVRM